MAEWQPSVKKLLGSFLLAAPAFFLLTLSITAAAQGGQVMVAPGDDLQALVKANPAGTTFVLQPGVHHDGVESLKNGDVFTSPSGTTADGVMENGAKTLDGWTQVTLNGARYWTTAGGIPLKTGGWDSSKCEPGFDGCFHPQNLYFDNADYIHVTSLASVAAGRWYYDFNGGDGGVVNNIYLTENPTGHIVELGAHYHAFYSYAVSSITIQGLMIEKYAPFLMDAAISIRGPGWLVQNNEIRLNHGSGVLPKPGGNNARVLNNSLHDNGDFGFGAGGVTGGVFQGNTVYHNNIDHTLKGFGAGGGKFGGAINILVSSNTVHDNDGVGLWCDAYGNHQTYDHNTSYNNTMGIAIEICNDVTVTNNVVYGNGRMAQIGTSSSSNVDIEHNTVTVSGPRVPGIAIGYTTARGGCGAGCTIPTGMKVLNNYITLTGTRQKAAGAWDYSHTASSWQAPGMFDGNTYCVPQLPWTETSWMWGQAFGSMTWSAWQAAGQDIHGHLLDNCSRAPR
jgi:hypothetical protein